MSLKVDRAFCWNTLTPAGGGFGAFVFTWFPIVVFLVFIWKLLTGNLDQLKLVGWIFGPIGLYPLTAVILNFRNKAIVTADEIIIRRGLLPWFGWQRLRLLRKDILKVEVRSEMTFGTDVGDSPDRYEVYVTLRDGSNRRVYRKYEGKEESTKLKALLEH